MTEIPQDRYADRLEAWERLNEARAVAGPEDSE